MNAVFCYCALIRTTCSYSSEELVGSPAFVVKSQSTTFQHRACANNRKQNGDFAKRESPQVALIDAVEQLAVCAEIALDASVVAVRLLLFPCSHFRTRHRRLLAMRFAISRVHGSGGCSATSAATATLRIALRESYDFWRTTAKGKPRWFEMILKMFLLWMAIAACCNYKMHG